MSGTSPSYTGKGRRVDGIGRPEDGADPYPIFAEMAAIYGKAEARFVRRKAWLAHEDVLLTAPFVPGSKISSFPAFSRRRLWQLWLQSWKSERLVLPTSAEALQVSLDGHRLRAFDTGRARSFKIVREASRYGEGTVYEVGIRRDVLPGSGVPYPVIHAMNRRGAFLFMEEDLLLGRSWSVRRDGGTLREAVVEPLNRLYRHYGISKRPLDSVLKPALTGMLAELGGSLPLLRHLRALIERNPLVSTSLCHGDLLPSNLAVTRTGVVFLDWEKAREHIVGSDLVAMALKYGRYRGVSEAAAQVVERFQGDRLSFRDGLALRLLEIQAEAPTGWAQASRRWVEHAQS